MEIGIIRMSSKGQIVLPSHMRRDLSEGDQLLVIREGDRFILKPLDELEPGVKDDLLFAEKTERAFLEFEKGGFTRKKGAEFINELNSW